MKDIDSLQVINSKKKTFLMDAMAIFFRKWAEEVRFVEYFNEEWFKKNQNCFEGAKQNTSSANNALEETNRVFKEYYAGTTSTSQI